LLLAVQEDNFTGPAIVCFLEGLAQQTEGLLVLVWDGLPAHRSRVVKAYLAENAHWLRVERFPAYAPELNPVEYLWSSAKGKDLANLCPDTLEQVEAALECAGQRIGEDAALLAGLLRASSLFGATETLKN
jgi:putative transposase